MRSTKKPTQTLPLPYFDDRNGSRVSVGDVIIVADAGYTLMFAKVLSISGYSVSDPFTPFPTSIRIRWDDGTISSINHTYRNRFLLVRPENMSMVSAKSRVDMGL